MLLELPSFVLHEVRFASGSFVTVPAGSFDGTSFGGVRMLLPLNVISDATGILMLESIIIISISIRRLVLWRGAVI